MHVSPTRITIQRLPAKHRWTDAALMALPHGEFKYELLDGDLIMSPASLDHGEMIIRLSMAIAGFVYEHELGAVYDGQTGFKLSPKNVLSPDISFVVTARIPPRPKKLPKKGRFFPGAPDLAVEVLSPGETSATINRKIELYFAHGTRLAWVIDPYSKAASVYHAPTPDTFLTAKDSLRGEGVLPDFRFALSTIFRD